MGTDVDIQISSKWHKMIGMKYGKLSLSSRCLMSDKDLNSSPKVLSTRKWCKLQPCISEVISEQTSCWTEISQRWLLYLNKLISQVLLVNVIFIQVSKQEHKFALIVHLKKLFFHIICHLDRFTDSKVQVWNHESASQFQENTSKIQRHWYLVNSYSLR